MNDIQALLANTQKVLYKLNEIQEFENYEADKKCNIKNDEISRLIEALKAQYDFMYYAEETYELYKLVKDRTQQFWAEEFSFLGDVPAYVSNSQWIGGISIKPLFVGIYQSLLKH